MLVTFKHNMLSFFRIILTFPGLLDTRFTKWCFKFMLWDVALVRSSMEGEFSGSVWDRCQPSIVRNLGGY